MSTRELIATIVAILASAAVLLGITGATYLSGRENNHKEQRYVTDCTSSGGSVINSQCINLRDLKVKEG